MRTSPEMDTMEVVEMEIAHLELRYAHTRIIKRESLVTLAASIEQWGQIIPVITVAPRVLIDGYLRVAVLKLCKRDTVLAEHWSCREDKALLRVLVSGSERRWDVVEQAALIRELIDGHQMSGARVAERLGRNPSWVARRLSLLDGLPEEILQKVRAGCLSSWAASRVLAPLGARQRRSCRGPRPLDHPRARLHQGACRLFCPLPVLHRHHPRADGSRPIAFYESPAQPGRKASRRPIEGRSRGPVGFGSLGRGGHPATSESESGADPFSRPSEPCHQSHWRAHPLATDPRYRNREDP